MLFIYDSLAPKVIHDNPRLQNSGIGIRPGRFMNSPG